MRDALTRSRVRGAVGRSLAAAAAAAALGLSTAAEAALTVHTSASSFAAAVGNLQADTFASLPIDFQRSPIERSTASYGYAVAAPGGLYGTGPATDPWLSTNRFGAVLTFSDFSGGVTAIGGQFFGSTLAGVPDPGQRVRFMAVDSLGASSVYALDDAARSSFVGFVSTGTMVSLTADIGTRDSFVTVDNLVLAQAIPEPQTYALLLAGLGALGLGARRRQRDF